MINVKVWENNILNKNNQVVKLLKNSFKINNVYELNLVKNKTYMISITVNNNLIGSISLISNDDLIAYLKTKTSNIESMIANYSIKATPGIYIYNLAVNKNFRNQGIAQKLIDIAIYIAKFKKFNYCHTHCENDISHHMFKKRKFNVENVFLNDKKQTVKLMTSWL